MYREILNAEFWSHRISLSSEGLRKVQREVQFWINLKIVMVSLSGRSG